MSAKPDSETILEALKLMMTGIHEIRIPRTKRDGPHRFFGPQVGYFSDPQVAKRVTMAILGEDAEGVYVTLNPVNPALLARAQNRIRQGGIASQDTDVTERRLLLVDIDSVRPSGISATDEELKYADLAADRIADVLLDHGFPEPLLVVMTGNGMGLLYKTNLPNDAETTDLVRRWLEGLSLAHDDDYVKVDTTVHNAARIVKIPGTVAAKGDDLPNRPWRTSEIVCANPEAGSVTREMLEKIARPKAMTPRTDLGDGTTETPTYDIPDLLSRAEIGYSVKEKSGGVNVYELDRCLTSDDHLDGACVMQFPSGAVEYKCHHQRCSDKSWKDVKELLGVETRGVKINVGKDRGEEEDYEPPQDLPFPVLHTNALHGLAGEWVRTIEPHSEADQASILGTFLALFGSMAGRNASFPAAQGLHHPNLYVACVGRTAMGKGASWNAASLPFKLVDPTFMKTKIVNGLSTGEGFAWEIRDKVEQWSPKKGEWETADPGVDDKRLFAQESEFGQVLKMSQRQGNTLTDSLRLAWDGEKIGGLTKTTRTKCEEPHVGMVVHCTRHDLEQYLTEQMTGNGFANRYLWLCTNLSKFLPDGGDVDGSSLSAVTTRLRESIEFAQQKERMYRDEEANALWRRVYQGLREPKPGLFGALVARAAPHVLRLSMVYALLDSSHAIRSPHLEAALAMWKYAQDSVRYVFRDKTGDPVADKVLEVLSLRKVPLTLSELNQALDGHTKSDRLRASLDDLVRAGRLSILREQTKGRPKTLISLA